MAYEVVWEDVWERDVSFQSFGDDDSRAPDRFPRLGIDASRSLGMESKNSEGLLQEIEPKWKHPKTRDNISILIKRLPKKYHKSILKINID